MIFCFQHNKWILSDFFSKSGMQPQPSFHLFSLSIVTYACRNLTFPHSKNCECIKSPAVFDLIKLSFQSSFVILIQSIAPQSGSALTELSLEIRCTKRDCTHDVNAGRTYAHQQQSIIQL